MKNIFFQSFFRFPVSFEFSFLSSDVSCNYLLDDFRKKFLFLYQSICCINYNTDLLLRSYFILDNTKYNRFLFLKSEINFVRSVFQKLSKVYSCNNFEFKAPIKNLFYKLRFLGFVHVYKRRPVANVNYIFFEDSFILRI